MRRDDSRSWLEFATGWGEIARCAKAALVNAIVVSATALRKVKPFMV
jgi:hypothetical protein